MIKFKHVFLVGVVSLLVYACGSQGGIPVDNFDHAAQAVRDNDTIVKFLQNHYYDATEDIVKQIDAGQTSLFNDTKLRTQDVVETINNVDIDYKLYTYIIDEGTSSKGNPTVVDSVLVSYNGQRIINTERISGDFDRNVDRWFVLGAGVIRGWSYGFTNFKGGENITTPNNPLTYENTGKGIIFIPSGLAYRNLGNGAILGNESLIFYIELNDIVVDTDADRDGIPSIQEDINGDGIPWNDDTDEDNAFNFVDNDDDGDGILTRFEDANKDGDPTNDFSDPNNPTLPDYLNPSIRVSNQ